MSPRFVLGRENVPCVAEVVNRSLKADCTDFNQSLTAYMGNRFHSERSSMLFFPAPFTIPRPHHR